MDGENLNKNIKICVALSGGVDSSVAALLLKRQGYDVFAMFMQNWRDADSTLHGDCEWEEDRLVAEMVARKLAIPFYFIDLSKEYRKRVVDYMFDEYSKGRTPNPDVLCNREIKFAAFLQAAQKLGADMLATGHYCRKESITTHKVQEGQTEAGVVTEKTIYRLLAGKDPNKDQSYFLCQLTQEQLSKAIFPIGHLLKSEVRQLASENDLASADKKDSQGICFVGKVDLPTFLQQKLKSNPGPIIEIYDEYFQNNAQYKFNLKTLSSLLKKGETLPVITSYISENKTSHSGSNKDNALKNNDLVQDKENENISQIQEEADEYNIGNSIFDINKIKEIDEDLLLKISQNISYHIDFEEEIYRSGKKHIKKSRYKAHPFGKIIGEHEGAQFYTIGQRKGLNVGGHKESLFVIGGDILQNTIYVGEGHSHKGLSRNILRIKPEDLHWIREDLIMNESEIGAYKVRIRYRQPLQNALLIMRKNGLYILFENAQRGITSGQFAVWYDENQEMLGSGIISE